MRNLIIVFVLLVVVLSCNKENNNSGIVIKGTIPANLKSTGARSADGLSLSDAKKVFVVRIFHGGLSSDFVDIVDGSFSTSANIGMSTALVFLGENNSYIGTLSSRELNLLPLNNLSEGDNTTINLADLSLEGTNVIPEHDPLGSEIIISDAEVSRLRDIDGFFESLAKNIDADNDNVLDALNNKQLFVKTRFWTQAYYWGLNDVPPKLSDIDLNSLGYTLELQGGAGFNIPTSVTLEGPVGSPYNDIHTQLINPVQNGGFFSLIYRIGGLFMRGTYNLTIDGRPYTLNYSNNDVRRNLLFILPTLHTNSSGQLTSVTLEYKLPDGTTIDPVNILTDVMLQFNNDTQVQYFDSPRLLNMDDKTEGCNCVNGLFTYTPASPIDISHLKKLVIAYNDLLGNTYIINWQDDDRERP